MFTHVKKELDDFGFYRLINWLPELERYPWKQDPFRIAGVQPAIGLTTDLQMRLGRYKAQIGQEVVGICTCRVDNGIKLSIEPDKPEQDLQVSSGLQAVINIQTGDLWISYQPLSGLIKPYQTSWQEFIQFTINA